MVTRAAGCSDNAIWDFPSPIIAIMDVMLYHIHSTGFKDDDRCFRIPDGSITSARFRHRSSHLPTDLGEGEAGGGVADEEARDEVPRARRHPRREHQVHLQGNRFSACAGQGMRYLRGTFLARLHA